MLRPRAHVIGELGEVAFVEMMTIRGWLMTKLTPDYGFDYIGQPVEAAKVTADFVLFQVKARDRPLVLRRDGTCAIRVSRAHAELWSQVPVPTFLAVVELPTRRIFLTNARESVRGKSTDTSSVMATFTPDALLSDDVEHRIRAGVNAYWSVLRDATGPAAAAMALAFVPGLGAIADAGSTLGMSLFASFVAAGTTQHVVPANVESFKLWLQTRLRRIGGA